MSTGDTCWPTSAQHLLLQAVLFSGTEALDAWQRWKAAVAQNRLDPGSSRFLPQLYRNLERERVRDPSMDKLRELYSHTWFVNQLRLRGAAVVIRELAPARIDAMLLKGAALTLLHYRNPGCALWTTSTSSCDPSGARPSTSSSAGMAAGVPSPRHVEVKPWHGFHQSRGATA